MSWRTWDQKNFPIVETPAFVGRAIDVPLWKSIWNGLGSCPSSSWLDFCWIFGGLKVGVATRMNWEWVSLQKLRLCGTQTWALLWVLVTQTRADLPLYTMIRVPTWCPRSPNGFPFLFPCLIFSTEPGSSLNPTSTIFSIFSYPCLQTFPHPNIIF